MQWSDAISAQIAALKPVKESPAIAARILSLLDLTNLDPDATDNTIAQFFEKAEQTIGHVAAVCVSPAFVTLAATEFSGRDIKVATVANFPLGDHALDAVLIEINTALSEGAQEIDVVFPYHRYLAGERQYAQTFVSACKAACGESLTLKIILETGVLNDPTIIADAAYDVFAAGADFVKTSTGTVSAGATLEAAATLLLVTKHAQSQLTRPLGVKVSGGIRTLAQAVQYVSLADNIFGEDKVIPATFRIGASGLIDEILQKQD